MKFAADCWFFCRQKLSLKQISASKGEESPAEQQRIKTNSAARISVFLLRITLYIVIKVDLNCNVNFRFSKIYIFPAVTANRWFYDDSPDDPPILLCIHMITIKILL